MKPPSSSTAHAGFEKLAARTPSPTQLRLRVQSCLVTIGRIRTVTCPRGAGRWRRSSGRTSCARTSCRTSAWATRSVARSPLPPPARPPRPLTGLPALPGGQSRARVRALLHRPPTCRRGVERGGAPPPARAGPVGGGARSVRTQEPQTRPIRVPSESEPRPSLGRAIRPRPRIGGPRPADSGGRDGPGGHACPRARRCTSS